MLHDISAKLKELGHSLPAAPAPAANYVPFKISGNQIFISGQISSNEAGLITGKIGQELTVEEGVAAAQTCALALLAQANAAVNGDFSKIKSLVKLVGFVNSTPDFTDQPKVINGASDLMVAALGEEGRHARSAVSAGSLPLGVAVEIEAIFELA